MGIFRSETMSRGTLVLPSEGARDFLDAIGSSVQVQFVDMNAQSMSRQYKRYVQRLEEMERILRFLFAEIEKHMPTRLQDTNLDVSDSEDEASDAEAQRGLRGSSRASLRTFSLSGGRPEDGRRSEQELEEGHRGLRDLEERQRIISAEERARERGDPQAGFDSAHSRLAASRGGASGFQLDKVEEALSRLYTQFVRFSQNNEDLLRQRNAAIEETCLLLLALHQLALPGQNDRGSNSTGGFQDSLAAHRRGSSSLLFESTASLSLLEAGVPGGALGGRGASPHRGAEGFGEELGSEFRSMAFSSVAGVINSCDQEKFARALFRSMRGNAYTYFQPADLRGFPADYAKTLESKSLFVTYYQGGRSPASAAFEKVMRLCAAFNARCYRWPSSCGEAEKRFADVSALLADKEKALRGYEQYFLSEISILLEPIELDDDAAPLRRRRPLIEEWRRFCVKEKAIYATLNFFEASDVTVRADCWFPAHEEARLRLVIAEQSSKSRASAFLLLQPSCSASSSPPTFFRLPAFLTPFQQLVDTYGVPRYKEANPAVFACVFFPFLFGIMYGDIGHGLVLLCIAAALFYIKSHNRVLRFKGETVDMLLDGRHMILLLGLYATYAGLVYNDVLSLGVDLFGSRWQVVPQTLQTRKWPSAAFSSFASSPAAPATFHEREGEPLEPMRESFPYPFGFDPAWKGAVNELLMFNSFKMKFSVIVGFFQMLLGILLKALNALYFGQFLDFFFEAVPQLLLFVSLIGYMAFLIVFKWLTPVGEFAKPSLINVLIDMHMGGVEPDASLIMFEGQARIQQILRVVVLLCIPVMLLAKPTWLWIRHKRERAASFAPASGASASVPYRLHRPAAGVEVGGRFGADSGLAFASSSRSALASGVVHGTLSRRGDDSEMQPPSTVASFSIAESVSRAKPPRGAGAHRDRFGGDDRLFDDVSTAAGSVADGSPREEEEISEVFIHQMIETIEFVLGTISNTASYLRLWALSLAHQQLSLVFFEKTLGVALQPGVGAFAMTIKFVLLFPLFAVITFFVMICMDSLECFLHALRLQWVEFQSKFFKADGHAFAPLSFSRILRESKLHGNA
ncbi:putative vacuolar proton translocating ATPase subunit [Besnoitia besnoiti]|uniref:Putative vacuolar proton translocating ATPase subunit n=1 Tax=Besnoitia besnoiti TaxID=94643 RepID=A0A2A9M0A2_BESBE|nr:putative vacuolar proton translocating ATPase subunit [Besnoitia besnoiti]PFH32028.1 putative vacuolar proton translocating ATPase subunit [Besnoitia besnoiti]